MRAIIFILVIGVLSPCSSWADKTQYLWKTLNGTNIDPTGSTYAKINAQINAGNVKNAAYLSATAEESSVAQNIVRQIFTPLAGREINFTEPVGDFTATFMVKIINQEQFKDIFTSADYYGTGYDYSSSVNNFNDLFNKTHSDQSIKELVTKGSINKVSNANIPVAYQMGVITSTQYGKSIFEGGTNRRAIKKIVEDFLCVENIEKIMNFSINDVWVGRDIPRTPGGNSKDYLNRCVGCHAGLDAVRGAFAKLDFMNNTIVFTNGIQKKMNNNPGTFPDGYAVTDDSWQQNGWLPLAPDSIGQVFKGPKPFIELIINSPLFYKCMAKRSHQVLCPSIPLDETDLGQMAYRFQKKQNFLDMLADVASTTCLKEL